MSSPSARRWRNRPRPVSSPAQRCSRFRQARRPSRAAACSWLRWRQGREPGSRPCSRRQHRAPGRGQPTGACGNSTKGKITGEKHGVGLVRRRRDLPHPGAQAVLAQPPHPVIGRVRVVEHLEPRLTQRPRCGSRAVASAAPMRPCGHAAMCGPHPPVAVVSGGHSDGRRSRAAGGSTAPDGW